MVNATAVTASALASALTDLGFRTQVLPADPPRTNVGVVNVWLDGTDRYPTQSVWEPYQGDGWEWGGNFEHTAPADIAVDKLVERVLATLEQTT